MIQVAHPKRCYWQVLRTFGRSLLRAGFGFGWLLPLLQISATEKPMTSPIVSVWLLFSADFLGFLTPGVLFDYFASYRWRLVPHLRLRYMSIWLLWIALMIAFVWVATRLLFPRCRFRSSAASSF